MDKQKLVVTTLSHYMNVTRSSGEIKQEELNNSGSSSENTDPQFQESKDCVNDSLELDVQDKPDIVTFTQLENKSKKDFNGRCRFCSSVFTNPVDLLRHKRVHSTKKIILPLDVIENYYDYPNKTYCPICKEKLKTKNFKSVFIKHLLTHTSNLNYTCAVCRMTFKRRDHMISHQKRHVVPLDKL